MDTIRLCGRLLPVVPQKHARLRHYLTQDDFQAVLSKEYSHESYRVLSVLIPALKDIPEWEWDGFGSEEAWKRYREGDRDAYDETRDNSPTPAEIVEAFEKSLMVSGANRLGKLVGLIQAGSRLVGDQQTPTSLASPGQNGESVTTTTGT